MTNKEQPLHLALTKTLQSLDAQVARAMQRTPLQEEQMGVQKWVPYQQRIEELTSFILDGFAEQTLQLDGILILVQSLSKTLSLACQELGAEGLGSLRSKYIEHALEQLERDISRAKSAVATGPLLS